MRCLFPFTGSVKNLTLICLCAVVLVSCNKFLDKKPDKSRVLVTRLDDVQQLLDNSQAMNFSTAPGLLELAADDYYVTDDILDAVDILERNTYLWDPASWNEMSWVGVYQNPIYYSNFALDQMPSLKIRVDEKKRYEELEAAALFYRAWSFFSLAQLYSPVYKQENLQLPSIVLRKTAEILDKSERATVKETYDQIIADLNKAVAQLPEITTVSTRPSKAAAFGALARVHLSMRDYASAGRFADSCLLRKNYLLDFNTLDSNELNPFDRFNRETVFFSTLSVDALISMDYAKADTVLVQMYAPDDLRRGMFFTPIGDGTMLFTGSYEGGDWYVPFNGIATDEMLLVSAEAAARAGNKDLAMGLLDQLLSKRFASATYTPPVAADAQEALAIILRERRKELTFRGVRWMDLRRLNEENGRIDLKRLYKGETYSLPAKDLRWTMLIPPKIIQASQIPQNPR